MRLEVERRSPVEQPTEKQVRSAILKLRSYGPHSYASLTDEHGSYLQVAGGGVTCLLERHDASTGKHFRAFHGKPSSVFADGTALVFSGGAVRLRSDEWFSSAVVAEAFSAFTCGSPLPEGISWRDVTESLDAKAR
ncbi:hypothetical protein CSW64_07970 [Caulobacter mirabilis]|uniref:Uncharacterized protein n=1 Tax=Caulobacter mirabilis TaxID=69666 RepID=A0A2D2AWG2_9CAUL|nr:hypothetical protein CSW64_07970 [Caulobacter mirabilis]